jgi:hypothetical protein
MVLADRKWEVSLFFRSLYREVLLQEEVPVLSLERNLGCI